MPKELENSNKSRLQNMKEETAVLTNDNENEKNNANKLDTKVYLIRWWVIAIMTVQVLVIKMLTNSFGVINNVYKAYFDVSYYVIDWFTLIQTPGRIGATIILALLSFNSIIGFRKLFIVMTACTLISSMLLVFAFAFPQIYELVFLGQFAAGFGYQTASALIPTFATLWFPETQIGLAMSFKLIGMSIGSTLAFLVPTQMVSPLSSFDQKNVTSRIQSNTTDINETNVWKNEVHWKFMLLYGVLLAINVIVVAFVLLFVTDQPPKPPTIAQALVRSQKNYGQPKNILKNMENFLNACKSIWFDKVVFQTVLICGFTFSSNYFQKLFMGQVVREVFAVRKYGSLINAMSGYVLVVYDAGYFCGGLVSGKILDRFKKYIISLCVALILSIIAMFGLAVGRYFYSIEAIFVFIALLGFSLGSCDIPTFDIVLQHTYPKSPTFVMLLFTSECRIVILLIGQCGRFVLSDVSATAVLIFMGVNLTISLVLSIFLKPNYNRQQASNIQSSSNEETSLLSSGK